MASPTISIHRILAASPATTRGQSTPISADRKGKRIAYASGSSIFIRSIDDPADCREYTGHQYPTTVARFSPNGFKVASGDSAGTLRVWEPETIETTRGEYSIISGPLQDIAWDGDSQRLIAVGNGRNSFGRCITADSGNTVGDIQGHTKPINAVAIKEKRPYRAVTVGDDSNAVFYTGVPFTFKATSALHTGFIFAAAFSPDGSRYVTVGQDKRIQLYDGTTGEPTKHIGHGEHAGSIFGVAWSEDGKRFATASADQTVKLWDVDAGTVVQTWKLGEGVGSVRDQQVGVVIPHGRADGLIVSVNLAGELTYLQPGKPEPVRVVQGHDRGITAIVAGSDGSGASFLTGSFDGRVCQWDARTGLATLIDGQPHTNQIAQLVSGPDGKVFSVGWDDNLKTVDESAKTFLGQTTKLPGQPRSAAAHGGGNVYVATSAGVAVYTPAGRLLKETPLKYTPEAIAVHGSLVAVGGLENSAEVFRTDASGALTRVEATIPTTLGSVSALAFSRDGSHLAVGNSVGKIVVYGTRSWELVTDRWSAHTARVTAIAWDDSGRYAASGSLDTNVFVWCLDKKHQGERIKAANAHTGGATGVAWIEGGRVVSCGKDATVKIWDLKNLP
ncbi:putative WD repeat-containing protein [Escovopsis weberi]|uniref:Putative WD repeat-containing protein n=1 Tax=Escovopsis weberi TaxID=150374 RepID=A0A0M8N5F8_ESCWE|nr:putative WD repeat-containing protein [Escovopsis weberi]